ncbi:hypothetical protein ACQP3J_30985, partial [Escherichia coli]
MDKKFSSANDSPCLRDFLETQQSRWLCSLLMPGLKKHVWNLEAHSYQGTGREKEKGEIAPTEREGLFCFVLIGFL